MTYLEAIILGIVQGLTEFLPVSSSGHLVIGQELLGIESAEGAPPIFELMVHAGTLLAVLIYFRQHLVEMLLSLFAKDRPRERMLILKLGLAMVPIVLAYLLFDEKLEASYKNPVLASSMLICTGILLMLPRWFDRPGVGGGSEVGWFQAIIMGIGQAIAILPGISRSGSTIVLGMLCGVKPARAAEFSFLLAIPAILGALVVKAKDFGEIETTNIGPYIAGTIAAFLFGLLAVFGVLESIRRGKFEIFGYYCLIAGTAALAYFKFGGGA